MKRLIILLAAVTMAASCIKDKDRELVKIGDRIPEFTVSSEYFPEINSREQQGRVVLVNLFATWCPDCVNEFGLITGELMPRFGDEEDFVFIAAGREQTDDELKQYRDTSGVYFPMYPDPDRSIYSLFADITIPRCYLFDREGRLVYKIRGHVPEEFRKMMDMIDKELQR